MLRNGLEKPFKQLESYAFSKYHSNKHFDLKQLSAQKNKVETQLEKLEERFVIGEIGQDLYQKYTQKFTDELSEIEQKIDLGQNDTSNLEKVTKKVIKVSKIYPVDA